MKPTITRTLANGKDREFNRCQGVCVDGRQCGNHISGDGRYCRLHGPWRIYNQHNDDKPRLMATYEDREAARMDLFKAWLESLFVSGTKGSTIKVKGKPIDGRIVMTYGRGRGRKRGRQVIWIEGPREDEDHG